MQLIISARDQVLARYGNALAALGEGQARTALSRALNHEGNKGRTQVKRALVKQTGIKYGAVEKATATIRATPATLTYKLMARGDEFEHRLVRWRAASQGCVGSAVEQASHLRACVHRAEDWARLHPHVEEPPTDPAAVRPEPRT